MEKLLIYLSIHAKQFLVGFFAGVVIHYFEIQVGNTKFNALKMISSSCIYGLLTLFGYSMIKAGMIDSGGQNEHYITVMSIMIGTFLYLFVPFVLKEENRSKFIESVMEKFGFVKQETGETSKKK